VGLLEGVTIARFVVLHTRRTTPRPSSAAAGIARRARAPLEIVRVRETMVVEEPAVDVEPADAAARPSTSTSPRPAGSFTTTPAREVLCTLVVVHPGSQLEDEPAGVVPELAG
jgi:hypothetical protein